MMTNAEWHGCPYPGWVCFHCGEVFTTVGTAADHFGTTPDRKPACQIKLGDERGLVMALRKQEDQCAALAAKVELAIEALEHRPSLQASHMVKLIKHLREANTTTLARRETQIKAASLERFIEIYLSPGLAHNRATGELDALRKQAEGNQ